MTVEDRVRDFFETYSWNNISTNMDKRSEYHTKNFQIFVEACDICNHVSIDWSNLKIFRMEIQNAGTIRNKSIITCEM